jgi:hypothetical protein
MSKLSAEQQECGVHAGGTGSASGLVYHIPIHAASGPQLLCAKSQDRELECLCALKAMAKGRGASFCLHLWPTTHRVRQKFEGQ